MKTLALVVCLSFVFTPACAHNPPTTVAAVADVATRVVDSASALLDQAQAAAALTNPTTGKPFITRAQLDTVALAVNATGRGGLALRVALDDYNAAKAAGKELAAQKAVVQKIVADITAAMQSVGKAIPAGTVTGIDQAIAGVFSLLVQVKAGAL